MQTKPDAILRPFDKARDTDAALRIWREAGWVKDGTEPGVHREFECGGMRVAEVAGSAECVVQTLPGSVRYQDADLPMSYVAGVLTSRVARRQGLASRLLAHCVAEDAAQGAPLCGLGAFELGYYDRLGFGTMGYERFLFIDPARLDVDVRPRMPRRLTAADWQAVYANRMARRKGHGSASVETDCCTHAEMLGTPGGFGLGYSNGPNGALTHHLWCEAAGENGPYMVKWMAYRTLSELAELLGLIRNLGDQVSLVRMAEPRGIQMQDLIRQPIRQQRSTHGSHFETGSMLVAPYQFRMLDVAACVARTRLNAEVRFHLSLVDPIESHLGPEEAWRGAGGDYIVTFGAESSAVRGRDAALPTLSASVGAFTRLWMGVSPASGLALTDRLSGPSELIAELDRTLRLPEPRIDWDL